MRASSSLRPTTAYRSLSGAALAIALSFAVGGASVSADPLFSRSTARDLALGESLRAAAVGTLSPELNPSAVTLTNELTMQIDYGYFSDASGSAFRGAACDSTTPIAGCVFYRYGTGDLGGSITHSAHVAGVSLAKQLGVASLGLTGKRVWYNGGTDADDFKAITVDGGLTIAPTKVLSVAGYGYNLVGNNDLLQREVGGGLAIRPSDMLTLSADGRWNVDDHSGEGTFGGGLEIFFTSADKTSGYSLRGGALHEQLAATSYVTGGLGYANLKLAVDAGIRKAVGTDAASTGEDLQLMISVKIFGPRGVGGEGAGT